MFQVKLCMALILVVLITYMCLVNKKKSNFDEPDHNNDKCSGEVKANYLKDIKSIENFLTPEECDHIIKISTPKLQRSTVMGSQKNEVSSYRTSDNIFMSRNSDPVLKSISDRVSALTGIPIENQEEIQILRYNKGKYYKPHYDACLDDTKNCKQDRKDRGVRINTAIMYLSDCVGGETSFNNLGKKITPKKGLALFFNPVYKDENGNYQHHPCSFHAAMPPISGLKFNLTVWSRDKKQKNIVASPITTHFILLTTHYRRSL